jgi:N-sulfoglucosamine sulfohydrolase
MPFILYSPAQARHVPVNDTMVSFTDVLPTVIDWWGISGPKYPLHGRSLLPVLDQPSPTGRDEVFFSHTFHGVNYYYPYRGIRTRSHKYVQFLCPGIDMPLPSEVFSSQTWQAVRRRRDRTIGKRKLSSLLRHAGEELYSLADDPLETTDVASKPENATLLHELRGKVNRFRKETNDPWLKLDLQR